MKIINGGASAPIGFTVNGIHCGIKKKKKDLALIYSEECAKVAGTFTANIVKAAPVVWDKKIVDEYENAKVIVITSGNANACTGEKGYEDNLNIAQRTADELNIDKEEVLVCSTGVIGEYIPMDIIKSGIVNLTKLIKNNENSNLNGAQAILTTDTFIKEIAVEFDCNGKKVTIGGMAKGSGMIHPNMATMLSFITTDANISKELLQKTLGNSIKDTYNMISIDGDTSTNDTVLVLANGMSGNDEIQEVSNEYELFKEAFDYVNCYLAKEIVKDGEGASKFIEVRVNGACKKEDARLIAKSIITSNLVKTALFGEDANWGRILCAMGYSGGSFDVNKVELYFNSHHGNIKLLENGMPLKFDEDHALKILQEKEVIIEAYLNNGDYCAKAWGCDLSYEYVKINGEYRT